MTGFELKYNDKITTASLEDGVVSVFLSKENETIHLNFLGLDNKINQHVTWFESIVNENDEIKIKIVEVNQVAKIIKSESHKVDSLENKLIEYKGMKNYLEKEGLIEKEG